MKTLVTTGIALACLALAGCHKTADQQLDAMYADQKAHDPAAAAETAKVLGNRRFLSDQDKLNLIQAYAIQQDAKKQLGVKN